MSIEDFFSNYRNHPVLFIGTGFSLRYLKNSYSWDGLLKKISHDIFENNDSYYDIKYDCRTDDGFDYTKIAERLEDIFNKVASGDRNGKFKEVNDIFYRYMSEGITLSRFKIYISSVLSRLEYRENIEEEIREIKKAKKNIASIITTNYDCLIEDVFSFHPLVGNDILLSNPYGSVYKIHGSVDSMNTLIITEKDYKDFEKKYELIKAQLISLFVHNPIIFIGYSVSDVNIKNILRTIFAYVQPNSEKAEKIRENFLLIEYQEDSDSLDIVDHDIDIEGYSTIRINKVKTNNFQDIYSKISSLKLPVSVMDIRKVQDVVKSIVNGGEDSITVKIVEDTDGLENSELILAIGTEKSISYKYHDTKDIIRRYFDIIESSEVQTTKLIDKITIQRNQWFPIHGFISINNDIEKSEELKNRQVEKIDSYINNLQEASKITGNSIEEIYDNDDIVSSRKNDVVLWSMFNDSLDLDEVEQHLMNFNNTNSTDYRKLLCFYDFKKYS